MIYELNVCFYCVLSATLMNIMTRVRYRGHTMAISAKGHAGPRAGAASSRIVVRQMPQAGLRCILLAIASLWLAVPTCRLLAGETTEVPGLGSSGVYWAGAVGVGLAVVALHRMVRRKTIVVEGGGVRVASRSLLGGHAWREPLASYSGIRARRMERPPRYGPRRWHVIELWHPDPAKTVELARTRDPCAGAEQAEVWAGRLTLPLCWEPHGHPARSGHEARDKVAAEAVAGRALLAASSSPVARGMLGGGQADAMVVMAHEQELVLQQTLEARDKAFDGRWPVPYAIMFATGVSAALWAMIIVAASWLIV